MSLISNVTARMGDVLTAEQLKQLEMVLYEELNADKQEIVVYEEDGDMRLLRNFVATKRLEGCTEKTIEHYVSEVRKMLHCLQKSVLKIDSDDIKYYLSWYQHNRKIKATTLNNMIRYINSFFVYLDNEDMIVKNPMNKIKSVKVPKLMKPTISSVDMAKLKSAAKCPRDVAIIEALYSTGCRVSELCDLNISDIKDGKAIVFGKGQKERPVYFTKLTLYYIDEYLKTRTDNNDALFVSTRAPFNRIGTGCIETMLRELWHKLEIERVHPHKFRRTIATDSLRKGMRLEHVQRMLGHSKIDTTMEYCQVDNYAVEYTHHQFVE